MKILIKPQLKHPHHYHIWKSLNFYISMDLPIYLPTKKVFVQTFFWKKYGWRIPYLPTIWTYVQNFVVFFIGPSPKLRPWFLSVVLEYRSFGTLSQAMQELGWPVPNSDFLAWMSSATHRNLTLGEQWHTRP